MTTVWPQIRDSQLLEPAHRRLARCLGQMAQFPVGQPAGSDLLRAAVALF